MAQEDVASGLCVAQASQDMSQLQTAMSVARGAGAPAGAAAPLELAEAHVRNVRILLRA